MQRRVWQSARRRTPDGDARESEDSPRLSCWDRGKDQSTFVGREVLRRAYTMRLGLGGPVGEQAGGAFPKMMEQSSRKVPNRPKPSPP